MFPNPLCCKGFWIFFFYLMTFCFSCIGTFYPVCWKICWKTSLAAKRVNLNLIFTRANIVVYFAGLSFVTVI